MLKLCSYCSRPAQLSVVFVLSSLGISPRLQKCSPAVLFCTDCFERLREQKSSDRLHSSALRKAVNNAYTALNQHLCERSQ